jgi:BirA family transcriptional regulator, biotin operon repressor / biotin---[acetyl-CoA-carboxylase] ligase
MSFNKILHFKSLDSSNDHAKTIASDYPHGTVVQSDIQTKGKGRGEHSWDSGPGGLYLSVILKPELQPQATLPITLITALAIARTLEEFGVNATIKWPNDILVGEKKLAGILTEAASSGDKLDYVVVGTGINLNNPLPNDLPAVSLGQLSGGKVDTTVFRDLYLHKLHELYQRFIKEGFQEMGAEWGQRAGASGKRLRDRKSGEFLGRFGGLAKDGAILYWPANRDQSSMNPERCYDTEVDLLD